MQSAMIPQIVPDASESFQRLLDALGVTCSMSRSGNVWDNSAMENFFSSIKTERTARMVHATRRAARADVFDSVERCYNPIRRYPTLGYLSPMDFEQQEHAAWLCAHGTSSRPPLDYARWCRRSTQPRGGNNLHYRRTEPSQ